MLVEAPVLRREQRLLDVLGNICERYPSPPLVLFEHLRKAFAPAVEHDARAGKHHSLELRMVRQIGGCLVVKLDDSAEVRRRYRDFFVLAELPVRRLQICKIDAVKSFVLASD